MLKILISMQYHRHLHLLLFFFSSKYCLLNLTQLNHIYHFVLVKKLSPNLFWLFSGVIINGLTNNKVFKNNAKMIGFLKHISSFYRTNYMWYHIPITIQTLYFKPKVFLLRNRMVNPAVWKKQPDRGG